MRRRRITAAEIEAGRSPSGGFGAERLRAWGLRHPLRAGWRERLLRRGVPAACPVPDGFAPAANDAAAVSANPLIGFSSAAPVELGPDPVEIFADGSCRNGAGGWGFAAYRAAAELHAECGGEPATTNNRMELAALIAALRWLDPSRAAILWTDSQYAVRGVLEWRHGWRKENWSRNGRGGVPNADLWQALFALAALRTVDVRYVRGHGEAAGNIRADALAAIGRRMANRSEAPIASR